MIDYTYWEETRSPEPEPAEKLDVNSGMWRDTETGKFIRPALAGEMPISHYEKFVSNHKGGK